MSMTGQKFLGALAVTIGVLGLVGMGIHEVANSCEKSTTKTAVADAGDKAVTVKASAGTCTRSQTDKNANIHATLAAAGGSSCCAHKNSAKTASYLTADAKTKGYSAECAAKIASGECTPADCEGKTAVSAEFASAPGNYDMYACSGEKKASAATASAEKSSCSSKEASASLVSSEGSSSSCSSSKSAAYARTSCNAKSSACAEFNACSVNAGDLVKADGEKLKHYEMEKAQDGVALTAVKLPEFTAMDLAGNEVHSSELIGHPTVLVMLATHCGHSYDSQPILQQAAADYEAKGLRVVGLVVGSSTEDAKKWIGPDGVDFDVWVTPDASVADALKSHLVPTYVLVDAAGNIKAKLIGFKNQKEVKKNIPVLIANAGDVQGSVGG